jgi:dTDP-4-dehydrorhamnose 3,5-epimerase
VNITQTSLREVFLIEPNVFSDERGLFFESFNHNRFREGVGRDVNFVQDNHSKSVRGVLRGLHYQVHQPQGKLVRVVVGVVYDVAVDLRRKSPSFGAWVGARLSAENKRMLWVPEGFAHGFLALSESAELIYKTTDYYAPEAERCIAWNDPELAINWPLRELAERPVLLSARDQQGMPFAGADIFS